MTDLALHGLLRRCEASHGSTETSPERIHRGERRHGVGVAVVRRITLLTLLLPPSLLSSHVFSFSHGLDLLVHLFQLFLRSLSRIEQTNDDLVLQLGLIYSRQSM